jgi:hypothetical protein
MMREESVAEVLCILYAMAAKKILLREPNLVISVGRAMRQGARSIGDNQAAHCIPGQILISDKEPSLLLREATSSTSSPDKRIMVALRLNGLFGFTQDLNRNFNYVDSRLEENGLRDAFRVACEFAIRTGLSESYTAKIDRSAMLHSFRIYKEFRRERSEDRTPWELTYSCIAKKLSNKDSEQRLEILLEETKVAQDYLPEKLTRPGIRYMENILNNL